MQKLLQGGNTSIKNFRRGFFQLDLKTEFVQQNAERLKTITKLLLLFLSFSQVLQQVHSVIIVLSNFCSSFISALQVSLYFHEEVIEMS